MHFMRLGVVCYIYMEWAKAHLIYWWDTGE
jgi:hypothetical protein